MIVRRLLHLHCSCTRHQDCSGGNKLPRFTGLVRHSSIHGDGRSPPSSPASSSGKRVQTVFGNVVAQYMPEENMRKLLYELRSDLISAKSEEQVESILSRNAALLLRPIPKGTPLRLITILKANRRPDLALQVFEWKKKQPHVLMEPHEYAKAIFLAGCLGKPEVASSLYEEMNSKGVHRTVEVENALMYIHAHAKGCNLDKALEVFQRLRKNTEDAAKPNLGSFNTALACHSKTQRLQHLEKTFDDLRQAGYLPSLETYNWLMLGYMRLGLWWRMEVVFSMMKASSCNPDGLTYRTLIRGYAAAQLTDRMQAVHEEMLRQGFELRSKTAEVMVSAYKKARDFPSMEKLLFSIKGKVFHTNMKKLKMRSYLCNSQLSAIDEIVDEALRNKELAFSPALADMVVRAYFK